MIGILYICTGKYVIFWEQFFLSAEKNFLHNHKKKYFVFTDAPEIYAEENPNVEKIYQENLGWPNNTLLRFEIFEKAESQLKTCSHIFFLNANMQVVDTVGDEILPDRSNDGLLAVIHPGFWNKQSHEFTYDRNVNSTAYIPVGKGKYYFMGGFNGGVTDDYLKLIRTLRNNIKADLTKNVIALWHDESHLNHYLLNRNPKILSPEYGYPEGLDLPFHPKILIRDKAGYGGHNFLRDISNNKNYKKSHFFHVIKKTLVCFFSFFKNQ